MAQTLNLEITPTDKEIHEGIDVLPIQKTPGQFDGAEFSFIDLLTEKIEGEVENA